MRVDGDGLCTRCVCSASHGVRVAEIEFILRNGKLPSRIRKVWPLPLREGGQKSSCLPA